MLDDFELLTGHLTFDDFRAARGGFLANLSRLSETRSDDTTRVLAVSLAPASRASGSDIASSQRRAIRPRPRAQRFGSG